MIKNSSKRVLKVNCTQFLGLFAFVLLAVSMLSGFSFRKSEKLPSGTIIVQTPLYRILFSLDTSTARRGDTPKSKMVELSYKYADLEDPPGQRFASSGGGKVRFLDKDGFAMGTDTFSIKDMESGDVYGFIWIDEARARQIVGADAVLLRPEELQQLQRQEAGYHPKLLRAAEEPTPAPPPAEEETAEEIKDSVPPAQEQEKAEEVKPETKVDSKDSEEKKEEVEVAAESPAPSPSPSESPKEEAPLFAPAPDNSAPEPEVYRSADGVPIISPPSVAPQANPTPSPSLSPSPAASSLSSPSPSPEPSVRVESEVFEHAGVKLEDVQKTLLAQQKGPQTAIPPSQTKVDLPVIEQTPETSPQVKEESPAPAAPQAAKEEEKDGVIFKQTFL